MLALCDALFSMDFSTPRRPHKTPAHTVKDLSARNFKPLAFIPTRQHFVPVSRLSYITFRFRQHPGSSFFHRTRHRLNHEKLNQSRGSSPPPFTSASLPCEGPRIIHPVSTSSTPSADLILPADFQYDSTAYNSLPLASLPPQRRGANHICLRWSWEEGVKNSARPKRTSAGWTWQRRNSAADPLC